MQELWRSERVRKWWDAVESYDEVISTQGVKGLAELDAWVRTDLPSALAARRQPHVTWDELVRVTRWKMARGVWRARNLALVESNARDTVVEVSRAALARVPDARAPIVELAQLAGVGPATASAVAAAAAPAVYPFFDDLVAAQIPDLGKVTYTVGYYARYAEALRARASRLGGDWTPAMVERALWSHAGGKAGARRGG